MIPDRFAETPEWFPFELDPARDRVKLLHAGEDQYRAAAFLDPRMLTPASRFHEIGWQEMMAAFPAGARHDAQYIFHLGNVGSTLISRLLGELPSVLALREPLLLRTFFEWIGPLAGPVAWDGDEQTRRFVALATLLSRTFRPAQRALVKATSFTSEIAWRLVPPGSHVLFLFATPRHYIENILAGENSLKTLELMTPSRIRRLQSRGIELAGDRPDDPAGKAALGWVCEMTSLEASASRLPAESVAWVDFDRFLLDPASGFNAIAVHFGQAADPAVARSIVGGSLMRRYSKALDYAFGPEVRREILAEAGRDHRQEIDHALHWLDRLASRYPPVAQAIRRVEQ